MDSNSSDKSELLRSQAKKIADISDGAIIGPAIARLLEKYSRNAPAYIGEYVKSMKAAIR